MIVDCTYADGSGGAPVVSLVRRPCLPAAACELVQVQTGDA